MVYLIFSPENTNWRISSQEFQRQILTRWPTAEIQEISDAARTRCLDFDIPMVANHLYGGLDRKGDMVAVEGPPEDCANFALWFRSIVPPSVTLIMIDEEYVAEVVLDAGMTVHQVLTGLGIKPCA